MTAASTDEQTSVDHLDFDVVCQVRVVPMVRILGTILPIGRTSKECGDPAVAFITCRTCGKGAGVCRAHLETVAAAPAVGCPPCGATGPLEDVYDVVTIGAH